MKVGSLFAGVGGFDLGFQRAGMETAWAVEIDKQARSVFTHHFPNAEIHEDVRGVGGIRESLCQEREGSPGDGVSTPESGERSDGEGRQRPNTSENADASRRFVEPVQLLCGGFPCQDYSVAGKRGGLAGDRGGLWWEFHRLIAECRPTWVVGENVPGLLSSNGGRDFLTIIASLVQLGYGVTWAVLDSQYFGVAQRRRRLFIVAHSGGQPRPEILALPEGLFGHPAPSREAGEGTTRSVAPSLSASGRGTARAGESRGQDPLVLAHPLTVREGKGPNSDCDSGNIVTFGWNKSKDQTMRVGEETTEALQASPQSNPAIAHTLRENYRNNSCPDAEARMHLYHGSIPRRLTPVECERLQGFPDGWTDVDGMKDGPRYRMMGNAVTVPVLEWIGHRIMEAEGHI